MNLGHSDTKWVFSLCNESRAPISRCEVSSHLEPLPGCHPLAELLQKVVLKEGPAWIETLAQTWLLPPAPSVMPMVQGLKETPSHQLMWKPTAYLSSCNINWNPTSEMSPLLGFCTVSSTKMVWFCSSVHSFFFSSSITSLLSTSPLAVSVLVRR